MQRVGSVRGFPVVRPRIDPIGDYETRLANPSEQFVARPQSDPFGKVRKDQPALATRLEMLVQAGEKIPQHPAARIEDCPLDGSARLARNPRRVADDQRRAARRKQRTLEQLDALGNAEPPEVLAC